MRSKAAVVVLVATLVVAVGVGARAAAQDRFPYSVASGDPRPDSVVLWTKVADPPIPEALHVEVATDAAFNDVVFTRDLVADAAHDYAVKLRVDGLEPYTTYYYRFLYGTGAAMDVSPVGRTRTAPAPDSPQPVRFAVIYCQDYIGRYWNSFTKLLRDHDEDIDFVVHLGDYVYETTGDPSFQDPGSERRIELGDEAGAIELGSGDHAYLAAASLDNYRDLYRSYHSDPTLQAVHERWPMIVIWDDHEYSDDSWGATATYFDGLKDEYDPERRRNAEQAFFEWVPIEVGLDEDGELAIDASVLYPNARIYRDFSFGSLLHLVMTDYRSYRPDHIVPEDAFPGAVVLDETTLRAALGDELFDQIGPSLDPYVDLDVLGLPILRHTATLIASQAYMMANPELDTVSAIHLAASKLEGNQSVTYLNALFAAAGLPAPFNEAAMARLPHGLSYLFVGKQSLYASTGSRYLVLNDSYNLLAAIEAQLTGGAAQDAFGGQQMAWLQGVVTQSSATWTVLASSVSMTPMILDFTNPALAAMLPAEFPDVLRTRLKLYVDQWDGFPEMRSALLDLLRLADNPIVISGDIHATFVTDHGDGVFEFTPPAVSSGTFGGNVLRMVASDPMLGQVPGIEQLVQLLPMLLQLSAEDDVLVSPSDILYSNTWAHGFAIMDAGADSFQVQLMEIPETYVFTDYSSDPEALDELFVESHWVVEDGQLTPVVTP